MKLSKPIRLSVFIARNAQRRMDIDVEYERGKRVIGFRVVVLPGNEKTMTRLCTNLPRRPFSLDLANEHIAAGLIWASLCAAVLKRFTAHAAQLSDHP